MKKTTSNQKYSRADALALKRGGMAAAMMEISGHARFDSVDAASIWMASELDAVKSKSYDKLYPELMALQCFPVNGDADPGAETITYYTYDLEGLAKIIDNYSTDLPRADVNGVPHSAIVKSVGVSYGYSAQEMRASRMAHKSLDSRKAEAARFQSDNTINTIAWKGDPKHNLLGVLSTQQNIPIFTITAGATSGKTKWLEKTAEEILGDIKAMYAQVARTTKNVEHPDTLLLPNDVYTELSMSRLDYTGETVLSFIESHAPGLKEVKSCAELNHDSVETNPYAAASGGQGVALLYTNSADKLEINNPMAFLQYPVQVKGLESVVPCEARTAGVIVFYPMSAMIALGV